MAKLLVISGELRVIESWFNGIKLAQWIYNDASVCWWIW